MYATLPTPSQFPIAEGIEILFQDEDSGIEVRWNSKNGAIAFCDIDTGFAINDSFPMIKEREKAITRAKRLLSIPV